MKKHIGTAIILGALLFMGSVPCFADAGAGASIQLTTTVTGGSGNSSSSGWPSESYTNWQYVDSNQPRQPSPYTPAITNLPLPTPPTSPQYTEEPSTSNPPAHSPASAAINWGFVLAIAVLAGAIGLLVYLVIRMRKKPEAVNPY